MISPVATINIKTSKIHKGQKPRRKRSSLEQSPRKRKVGCSNLFGKLLTKMQLAREVSDYLSAWLSLNHRDFFP